MKSNIAKLMPLLGIFSVILYFLHVILGEAFYEGYNPLAQAISDLTALNSPSKNIARLFSMLYGICVSVPRQSVNAFVFDVHSMILQFGSYITHNI